ncbi:MAG: FxsA family protein [Cellvibrionaceae bacterium]
MKALLLLFIVMPILEMWVLITVGGIIGPLLTIGLVLLTACIGITLLKYQGRGALLSARQKLAANEVPAREMADGLFFAIGGALLLTPGFITDAIGFACLTPGVRTVVIRFFSKHLFRSASFRTQGFQRPTNGAADPQGPKSNHVIDGDFERHQD